MSRPQVLLIAATLATSTALSACGSDDDDGAPRPAAAAAAAKPAAATPYDGLYEMKLTPAAARKIPDPSVRPGTYRLLFERGRYSLVSPENGPYGRGTVAASAGQLRFGRDEGEPCAASGRYDVTQTSTTLRLRVVADDCPSRRSFFDGQRWRVAER